MKALFNATCGSCFVFRPRCTYVYLRDEHGKIVTSESVPLCDVCRKKWRGNYRLHERHKAIPAAVASPPAPAPVASHGSSPPPPTPPAAPADTPAAATETDTRP